MILSGLVRSFSLISTKTPSGGGTKATVYVFNVFWDTEMIVNRFDTTSTTTETTARGWFFR